MTVVAKRKTITRNKIAKNIKPSISKVAESLNQQGTVKMLAISQVDGSPFNYRKLYPQKSLDAFAEELKMHDILSSLTVREMSNGRFEVVAGERRYRSAVIAGLQSIPAIIKVLNDDEVTEIQLAENLNREDPHPLHESHAVAGMHQGGKSIEEIALRLGRSKNFVYNRIKLAGLIEPIQEIFFADAITAVEALEISGLSSESQQDFYDQHCPDWKDKDFEIYNLKGKVASFKYNLKQAPFDIKDNQLLPEAGACSNCPFNSATLKSLFPELAKEAICSKKSCYKTKCEATIEKEILREIETYKPDALVIGRVSVETETVVYGLGEQEGWRIFSLPDVTTVKIPVVPEKENFKVDKVGKKQSSAFDKAGFEHALSEYKNDLEEFNQLVKKDNLLMGLVLAYNGMQLMAFYPDRKPVESGPTKVTAKAVQEAIKIGTVTVDILEGEIARINDKEKRSKEIDREKIQLKVHEQFSAQLVETKSSIAFTDADQVATRLLVYQSLDYSGRSHIDKLLFSDKATNKSNEVFYQSLANLTTEQFSYLVRMAIASKSESKYPTNLTAYTFYKVASEAGLNVALIEEEQAGKAKDRCAKIAVRLKDLKSRIKNLKKK